ncbi:ribosome-binding factor A, partial [Ferruginibacter sp.]
FKVKDNDLALKKIEEHAHEIKKELTSRVRHQLRSMPKLTFYIDDTLEYAEKIDKLFKEINESPSISPDGERNGKEQSAD